MTLKHTHTHTNLSFISLGLCLPFFCCLFLFCPCCFRLFAPLSIASCPPSLGPFKVSGSLSLGPALTSPRNHYLNTAIKANKISTIKTIKVNKSYTETLNIAWGAYFIHTVAKEDFEWLLFMISTICWRKLLKVFIKSLEVIMFTEIFCSYKGMQLAKHHQNNAKSACSTCQTIHLNRLQHASVFLLSLLHFKKAENDHQQLSYAL